VTLISQLTWLLVRTVVQDRAALDAIFWVVHKQYAKTRKSMFPSIKCNRTTVQYIIQVLRSPIVLRRPPPWLVTGTVPYEKAQRPVESFKQQPPINQEKKDSRREKTATTMTSVHDTVDGFQG
jgi:hypothetical protein